MSSHILLATVAAIALSTPAAEAPIDTEIKAILLDPSEAPIDTGMKIILWLENIERLARENTADAVRSGPGGRAVARTGPTIAEYRSAPTNANVAAE